MLFIHFRIIGMSWKIEAQKSAYQTVVQTKELSPSTTIETLIPDVKAKIADALYRMIDGGQEVVSHNDGDCWKLYRKSSPQARYDRLP